MSYFEEIFEMFNFWLGTDNVSITSAKSTDAKVMISNVEYHSHMSGRETIYFSMPAMKGK